MVKESILIFGVGPLQKSLIERCKFKGLFTVGIDPSENPACKDDVDAFAVVDGQDFKRTLEIAEKYNVKGIVTAATDKPLVMMARVAQKLNLPFFSVDTAICSTDKFLMKKKFQEADIPCAKGFLLNTVDEIENLSLDYPVIVKPRDNSGSRGVLYCKSNNELISSVHEALSYTNKGNVLVEEFIEGKEFSIEGIHFNGDSNIIQITEKITTPLPYNVELGHIQPADVTTEQLNEIRSLITKIAKTLGFENCASHTEIKINSKGIFVIETSPRLGGDFITSTLVPLSTGINMEDVLIDISLNSIEAVRINRTQHYYSGVIFFELPSGIVKSIRNIETIRNIKGYYASKLGLKEGDTIPTIKNSIDRYGYSIFYSDKKEELYESFELCNQTLKYEISIEPYGK